MIIRQIKKSHWEQVCNQIVANGKNKPMSLQIDLSINCNGIPYIMRVQLEQKQRLVALQVVMVDQDGGTCRLIKNNALLSALLDKKSDHIHGLHLL